MAEDTILKARLDALERNLLQVENSSTWLREGGNISSAATRHAGVAITNWRDDLWTELDATIGKRARRLKWRLKEVHDKLNASVAKQAEAAARDLKDAWKLYTEIHHESEEVFDECLEFIGGLAFRDKGFDQRICQVADELIRTCAFDSDVQWKSLTILTLQEKLGETLARIIRLRFPEWTIWTLPFTAHEFTYVVISKSQTLLELTQKTARKCMSQNEELKLVLANKGLDYDAKKLAERVFEQRAEGFLQKLVADAFATYTMGPAYACAALLLRFNPSAASLSEDSNHPTDIKRAEVVLSMLKRMNQDAIQPKPYDNIIERLEREWKAVLNHVAAMDAPITPSAVLAQGTPSEQGIPAIPFGKWLEELVEVDRLVDNLFLEFSLELRTSALYPPKGRENGWLQAQEWAQQFQAYMDRTAGDELASYIKFTPASKLRDALNAAWLNRVFYSPQNLSTITDAALKLCSAIINNGWDDNPPPLSPADKMVSTSTGPALPQKSFSKSQP